MLPTKLFEQRRAHVPSPGGHLNGGKRDDRQDKVAKAVERVVTSDRLGTAGWQPRQLDGEDDQQQHPEPERRRPADQQRSESKTEIERGVWTERGGDPDNPAEYQREQQRGAGQ